MTSWPHPSAMHAAQRRYLAEDLVRRRRSDEERRYSAPQRAAKIDANPHQIDAVIFALARVREGGCILADEVGLGKTIEAGLVIAQLLAEGARRVLLVAPKPLIGQWRQELFQLFDIVAQEGQAKIGGFDGEGVFVVGREAAGSERGREAMLAAEPFDLCVIDEAHEVFAGIYKRFDALGQYQEQAPHARTAGRLREVLLAGRTPMLLLTATPIQNSLAELWGLVQYVDPLGTLLGDLPTFREVFCGLDDRHLAPGQEDELRARLRVVLQRTLRRQAQEFLEKPFVDRQARLFEYVMSPTEKQLYDDVTRYLLEPGIQAFRGSHRKLLLLGFHRRMASSTRALAESLTRVVERLRRELTGDVSAADDAAEAERLLSELDGEGFDFDDAPLGVGPTLDEREPAHDPALLSTELLRVEGFVARARALGSEDSKFRSLLSALRFVTDRAERDLGAGKLVIFTESLVTQDYLRDRLIESRLVSADEITLFRGDNATPRARAALERWREEVPQGEGTRASVEIATRLALVHEFKTRSKVFIATEAGAKGLNLQFCNTVVNYDLPWNPQRIEQRIGRCHRYGQQHDVTVINFLAKDNEAQELTFDILSQKLELFGLVLDASDQVLHRPGGPSGGVLVSALGAELEAELCRIYERARTQADVTLELRALRDKVAEERKRFEETHTRTAELIEQSFDEDLRQVFRHHKEAVPVALAELDRDLALLVCGYLERHAIPYALTPHEGGELLTVSASPALAPELAGGIVAAVGSSKEHTSLHLNHPLVLAAVHDARAEGRTLNSSIIASVAQLPELAPYAGQRGRLRLMKLSFDGFERIDRLVPLCVLAGGDLLAPELCSALLVGELGAGTPPALPSVPDAVLSDATEEVLFLAQAEVDSAEQSRFERSLQQAERFVEDRLMVLKKRRQLLGERLERAEQRRDGATGSVARSEAELGVREASEALDEVEGAIARLERRDDETFRRFQDHIQRRRYAPPLLTHLFDAELAII
ncbi:MAG: SNF2-related protein [Polyangiaceae bacterium]